jgi:SulP family sulfate permease
MARLDETWPVLSGARRSVVLLDVRTMPDVPSSTIVKALLRRAGQLRASGSRLVVVGADDVLARVFERTGLTAVLRPGDVRPGTPVLLEALDAAYDEAVAWVARAEDVPDPGTG